MELIMSSIPASDRSSLITIGFELLLQYIKTYKYTMYWTNMGLLESLNMHVS